MSEGCLHCAAERVAAGRLKNHPLYKGLTKNGKWTGEIRTCLDIGRPDILEKPLHWRNPRIIFPCFMGDLFNLPFEFIDKIMAVIALCPQHTFLILTKQPKETANYFLTRNAMDDSYRLDHMPQWYDVITGWLDEGESGHLGKRWESCHKAAEQTDYLQPLKNLWLGVSVENDKNRWRIEELYKIPAAKRFVSFEPMLGSVKDFYTYKRKKDIDEYPGLDLITTNDIWKEVWPDLVIVGGESGPGARPMHPDWPRGIRDQCQAAGIPFFFKQWGAYKPWFGAYSGADRPPSYRPMDADAAIFPEGHIVYRAEIKKMTASQLSPLCRGGVCFTRTGKKAAGCVLDGKIYREMPE